ncbi:MAG: hypothetical protein N838_12115 [Thiohalocapsa sp. PB-PSB1]|nr:MAG: hypothetical protein N838_12115 [Thiohalocapsa sp. PB-PSB1]
MLPGLDARIESVRRLGGGRRQCGGEQQQGCQDRSMGGAHLGGPGWLLITDCDLGLF